MLLTPHTFIGIAIATAIPNPYVAVPLSFAMHFAADLIPHWDFFGDNPKEEVKGGWIPLAIFADMIVGVAVGMFFTLYALWVAKNPPLALNIFMCGVASVLPDALSAPSMYGNKGNFLMRLIADIQCKLQAKAGPLWGSLTQLYIIAVAFLVISSSMLR